MISVISPVYNEAENLEELVARVTKALDSLGEEWEYVLVENGSHDASLEMLRAMHARDPRVRFVSLSRNFGHQGGILAGLNHARGDAVISLDADLQQPPELIPRLVDLWRKGFDVVYTTKAMSGGPRGLRAALSWAFYRVISAISHVRLSYGQSDFRLLDRRVVDVIVNIPERDKFLRGLVQWVGFRTTGVEYEVEPRRRGESKFSLRGYMAFAVNGILSFSNAPLRLFIYVGLVVSAGCGLYAAYAFSIGLLNFLGLVDMHLPPGWATLAVSVMFLNALQFLGIGILGEYVGRVFTQSKGRPEYIVREQAGAAPAAPPPLPAPHCQAWTEARLSRATQRLAADEET